MRLLFPLLCLTLSVLVKYADGNDWCYGGCEHTPSEWGHLAGSFCGEKSQSPIDIDTSHVKTDHNLLNFTFVNFSSRGAIQSVTNTGHTAKCKLAKDQVEVSGGGLNGNYSTIQLHFHWGDTEHHPGSEHMVDGHRYPMEMHIVSLKKGLSVADALKDPEGIAVLGFFINATEDEDTSGPWSMITSYLTNITGTDVDINQTISIDDLIGNVDRSKFYRYMGSLTTPNCSEAVVWTVFHEPISVNKDMIQMFPMKTQLTNVYRPTQQLNGRQVHASPATPLPPSPAWCYDDHCDYSPSHWHLLPHSHCGGTRQSPVAIETEHAVVKENIDAFSFVKFDDKHVMEHITNTGHTVKCKLKKSEVEVSGGGLGHVYSTIQFHLHWGSENSGGSEHTMDSHRYAMEMHIVNIRKDLDLVDALETPNGLTVLAFFIEAYDETKSSGGAEHHETNPPSEPTSDNNAWKKLTKYLLALQNINSEVEMTDEISIDDLLGDVNRHLFYRYNGSLTTPTCNEAVVWTVFKESIKVKKELMMMFWNQTGHHNVFRPVQPIHNRSILSVNTSSASRAPASVTLSLLLACFCAFFI